MTEAIIAALYGGGIFLVFALAALVADLIDKSQQRRERRRLRQHFRSRQ